MRPRQETRCAAARYGAVPMLSPFYQFGKSRKRALAKSFGNEVKMRIASLVHVAALLIAVAGIPVLAQQNSGYLKTKVIQAGRGSLLTVSTSDRPEISASAGNTRSRPASTRLGYLNHVTRMS